MAKDINELRKKRFMIVHSGKYHADDVSCAAFFKIVAPASGVIRMSDIELQDFVRGKTKTIINDLTIDDVIVCDVGRGEYDHHGKECEEFRPNGVKYAAFGKLWRDFGRSFIRDIIGDKPDACIDAAFEEFDKNFVQPLDLTDNFGPSKYPNPISFAVNGHFATSEFSSNEDEEDKSDEFFTQCYHEFKPILKDALNAALKIGVELDGIIDLAFSTKDNVIFNYGNHVGAYLFDKLEHNHVLALCEPSVRDKGKWTITSVNSEKYPLPTSLKDAPGCAFYHDNRFHAVFDTLEHLEQAINDCGDYDISEHNAKIAFTTIEESVKS